MTEPSRFENADLAIVLSETDDEVTVSLLGSSDARDPEEFLQPVFQRVMRHIEGRSLIIDLTSLEFMNSSTVSPIIALVKTLDSRKVETRVRFGVEEWQQVHLRCMRTITRMLGHVQVEGPGPESVPSRRPRPSGA
ncbi:MAG: anti-sigma factor antagonist [Polyangiaceae bacterium]|nr:anti-sigma factor antagonist [Polyangiaceae bacterium]